MNWRYWSKKDLNTLYNKNTNKQEENIMLFKLFYFLTTSTPIGWLSLYRKQHLPCDESNRHNKSILLWFAFTRYDKFSHMGLTHGQIIKKALFEEEFFIDECPWLAYDMWESLSHVPVKEV